MVLVNTTACVNRRCLVLLLLLGLVAVAEITGVACQQCYEGLNAERQICEHNSELRGIKERSLGQPTFGPRNGNRNKRPFRGAIFRQRDDDPEEFQEFRVGDNAASNLAVNYGLSDNCTVTTFSSADTASEAENALAEIVLNAFSATTSCEDAKASAQAQSEAIAKAVATATARTEVKFSGDCDASDQGKATALASVDGTAIAEAFAKAVAAATNDNARALAAVSVKDIAVAIAKARAKSKTDLVGGIYAGIRNEKIQKQTTEVVAEALAKVTAAAFCDKDGGTATVNVAPVGIKDELVVDTSTGTFPEGGES